MAKKNHGERVGFNNYLGVTLMSLTDCIAAGLMTFWGCRIIPGSWWMPMAAGNRRRARP